MKPTLPSNEQQSIPNHRNDSTSLLFDIFSYDQQDDATFLQQRFTESAKVFYRACVFAV